MNNLKIAVIGPESTGKTSLCNQLANKYEAPIVNEYARIYIDKLDRPYRYEDLFEIAKVQECQTGNTIMHSSGTIISDTSLLTIEIWSKDKFNQCDSWILNQVQKERFDLYLLCDTDTPWVMDEQREDPNRRKEIFDLYQQHLDRYGFIYERVSGLGPDRLENAISAIENHLRL